MANEENLKLFTSEQSREEAQKNGRKGGIASGIARRERRKLKDDLLFALDIKKGDKTVQELGVEALLQKFIDGDIQAFNTVRDTIGEKPIDKQEVKQEITSINIKLEDEEQEQDQKEDDNE